jgi:transcriptional regulator with XRE-family HTH domain
MKIYDYYGRKNICGEKIRQARNKLRISQAALAAKLQTEGVVLERDCISRVESGARFVADYELMTFAKALGVSVDWLLSAD